MKKKVKIKAFCFLLIMAVVLLCACGKKKEEAKTEEKPKTEKVKEEKEVEEEPEEEPKEEVKEEKEEKKEEDKEEVKEEPEEDPDNKVLSKDDLAKIEKDFNSAAYNGFLQSRYTGPEYISWHEVFYNGAGVRHEITQEETQLYLTTVGAPELFGDLVAVKKADAEDFIKKSSGKDAKSAKRPLDWLYLDKADIYVYEHGDTNYTEIRSISGNVTDGIYSYYYDKSSMGTEGVVYRARFKKDKDGYVFISNEWFDENREKKVSDLYDEIIQKYTTALTEKWDMEKLEENGLSYMCLYAGSYDPSLNPLDILGYYLYDVDKDGVDELFIGENSQGGDDYLPSIYQMYTVEDGRRMPIIDGGERNRYYLAKDDTFYNEGSGSASNSAIFHYELTSQYKMLSYIDGVIYEDDFSDSGKGPYYYAKYDTWDTSAAEPVTKDFYEKYEKKAASSYVNIKYTPFSGSEVKTQTAADTSGGGYSDAELCQMALDHYEKHYNYRPGICMVDSEINGIVLLHLYDDMGDHIATSAWYAIDRTPGKGTDTIMGDTVDLNS